MKEVNNKRMDWFVSLPVYLLEDNELSTGALKLWCHLFKVAYFGGTNMDTRYNSFKISNKDIMDSINCTEDKLHDFLNELISRGYISRTITVASYKGQASQIRKININKQHQVSGARRSEEAKKALEVLNAKKHNRQKKQKQQGERKDLTLGQNDLKLNTAEKISKEQKVSR